MYFSDSNAHPGTFAGSHVPRQAAGNSSSEAPSASGSGSGSDSSSIDVSASATGAPTSSEDPVSSSTQGEPTTSPTPTSGTGDGQTVTSSTPIPTTSDTPTSTPLSTPPPSSEPSSTPLSSSPPVTSHSSTSTPFSTPPPSPTSSISSANSSPSPSPSPPSSTSPTSTSPTPIPSSSSSPTYSTSYTVINGVTSSTLVTPTTLSNAPPNTLSSNERSAIIAGSATGGALLLILALSILFYRRRKEFKRLGFIDTIAAYRRQKHSRATLLDGEDLEDVDLSRPPPGRYSDYDTPWDPSNPHMSSRSPSGGQTQNSSPSILLRARASDSGSVFREDVWPPPGDGSRLVDPLGSHTDLSRIVDDVMGPSASAQGTHYSQYSVTSSMREPSGGSMGSGTHSRSWSADSQSQLLEAAGLIPSSTPPSPSRQPIKPSPLVESSAVADDKGNGNSGAQGGSMSAATSKNWLHRSPLKNEVEPQDEFGDNIARAI